jgi:serine/threonine protein kinase
MDRSDCLSSAEDPNLGRTLRDRYRIDERIGSGSMGAVYRAWDLLREQSCAVKLLRLQVATRESIVIRFCDEARIVARLCHPSIVELYDQGEDPDGTLFLVMELLRGQDLYAYLRAKPRLPLCRVLEIVRQIGSALHTVHLSGVVHRDIKPREGGAGGEGPDIIPRRGAALASPPCCCARVRGGTLPLALRLLRCVHHLLGGAARN